MSYNMKSINVLELQTLQTKLKPEESSIVLYFPERCLTNCSGITKCQLKTIFVFINWYQLLSS